MCIRDSDEAMKIYEKIPADRMNGIKGIGFELHDGSIYDGQFPLMQADKIDEDIINMVEHYKKSPLVQQAIADCKEMIERKQDFEFAKDLYENGFVYDDYVITSAEAYDLRQDGAVSYTHMMGIDSCGMLMSAVHNVAGEERLNLIMLDDAIPAGAKDVYKRQRWN